MRKGLELHFVGGRFDHRGQGGRKAGHRLSGTSRATRFYHDGEGGICARIPCSRRLGLNFPRGSIAISGRVTGDHHRTYPLKKAAEHNARRKKPTTAYSVSATTSDGHFHFPRIFLFFGAPLSVALLGTGVNFLVFPPPSLGYLHFLP